VSTYSTQLFAGQPTSGTQGLYVVPSGYVVVVRDVELYAIDGGGTIYIAVWTSSGTSLGQLVAWQSPQPQTHMQWSGRVVMDFGQQLVYQSTSGRTEVLASGYLLTAA